MKTEEKYSEVGIFVSLILMPDLDIQCGHFWIWRSMLDPFILIFLQGITTWDIGVELNKSAECDGYQYLIPWFTI